MSRRPQHGARQYPRTARLNELVRQIVAEELERLDDDRLELVTVMAVDVDTDLRHATVHYAVPARPVVGGAGKARAEPETEPEAEAADVRAALAEVRPRLQRAIARQARMKRTPELAFRPDTVERAAARVEEVLRDLRHDPPEA